MDNRTEFLGAQSGDIFTDPTYAALDQTARVNAGAEAQILREDVLPEEQIEGETHHRSDEVLQKDRDVLAQNGSEVYIRAEQVDVAAG